MAGSSVYLEGGHSRAYLEGERSSVVSRWQRRVRRSLVRVVGSVVQLGEVRRTEGIPADSPHSHGLVVHQLFFPAESTRSVDHIQCASPSSIQVECRGI